jgi:hypothetical protein
VAFEVPEVRTVPPHSSRYNARKIAWHRVPQCASNVIKRHAMPPGILCESCCYIDKGTGVWVKGVCAIRKRKQLLDTRDRIGSPCPPRNVPAATAYQEKSCACKCIGIVLLGNVLYCRGASASVEYWQLESSLIGSSCFPGTQYLAPFLFTAVGRIGC